MHQFMRHTFGPLHRSGLVRRLADRHMRIAHPTLTVGIIVSMALTVVPVAVQAAPSTDAQVVDYAQCANGTSASTNCTGWINGTLNSNNSTYLEDGVTAQRAEVSLPAGGPTTG